MYYFDLIEALHKNKIRYLIVGGLAVNLLGVPRVTQDIDIIIPTDRAQILATVKVILDLGYIPRLPVNPSDLADPEKVQDWKVNKNMKAFSFYHLKGNYKVIDIVIDCPLNFDAAYERRVEFTIQDINIPVASIDDIILMKEASGRPVDESDIAMLREAKRISEMKK